MESCCYLRNVQGLLAGGKTPCERRFGEPCKGPVIPFGAMVEYHPISARDSSRLHQFGPKVLPGFFLGYALYAAVCWKEDILVADIEELEILERVSNPCSKTQCKGSTIVEKCFYLFPIAVGTVKWSGRDHGIRKSIISKGRSSRNSAMSQLNIKKQKMTEKPVTIFGRSKGTIFIVIISNLEFSSSCRNKKHSLHTHEPGCVARKLNWRFLEHSCE